MGVPFADWQQAEQKFFVSVDNLCSLYGWTKPDVSGLSFPQNIIAAYNKVTAQQTRAFELDIKICQDEKHACSLATLKTFYTGHNLYYIPVRPLWVMRGKTKEKRLYKLLLTVFGYLYQVAGVPYFREEGTIRNTYSTIKDWINEENDNEDEPFRELQKKELESLKLAGNTLFPEIKKTFSVGVMETALRKYQATKAPDGDLTEVVSEIIKLIKDYPKRAIKETMHYEFETEDDSDYSHIYWEQYISFYWSGIDSLNETLFDMLNNEFQEAGYQEEPLAVQWFDLPQEKPCHEFDFEPRFFALIDRLSEILNDYDYEEPDK